MRGAVQAARRALSERWLAILMAASVLGAFACVDASELAASLGIFVSWPIAQAHDTPPESALYAVLAMRLCAFAALITGGIHALYIVLWYARHAAVTPRRVWHVVSVGLGLLLLYEQLAVSIATSIATHAHATWQSPKVIAAVLFIGCGAQYLYAHTKREHRAA